MINATLAAIGVAAALTGSNALMELGFGGTSLVQTQAQLSDGREKDEATSAVNADLTCMLTIDNTGEEALVRWAVTGAVAIGLSPASAMESGLSLVGERVVAVSDLSWIHLTAVDAAGERIRCSVMVGGRSNGGGTLSDPVSGATEIILID